LEYSAAYDTADGILRICNAGRSSGDNQDLTVPFSTISMDLDGMLQVSRARLT
jgi:hypothetical protein